MNNVLHKTGKTSGDLAKKAIQQAAREPLEILKNIPKEFLGESKPSENQDPQTTKPQEPVKIDAQKLKAFTQRQIQALEAEIKDIRKMREEKDRQRLVPPPAPTNKEQPPAEPSSKKSRRLMGWGAKVKQLKSQTETRLPPSG